MTATVCKWVMFAVTLLCVLNGIFVLFLIRKFDPKQKNPYLGTDNALRASSKEDETYDCNDVAQRMETLHHAWEFNQLRRTIMMDHPSCMEDENIFSKFAEVSQTKSIEKKLKQYNLHIPKTGGTSLCDLAKQSHMNVPRDNCHSLEYDFIGNERWLDYNQTERSNNTLPYFCDELQYSITIRAPAERAMSQMNMYLHFFVDAGQRGVPRTELRTKQVRIIQSNYMTWSLVSGISDDPTTFRVGPEHLELAKQTLSGFDYILDIFGSQPQECLEFVLERMGFSVTKMPHSMAGRVEDYARLYDAQQYEMLNGVDMELYQYAQELIRVDCEFFRHFMVNGENETQAS